MSLTVQLKKDYGGFALDVEFTAPVGVTALFGRSGAGKTTVVNAVAGLMRPDNGRVTLDDRVLVDTASRVWLPPHKRRVGYVFQDARLFPHLTVRQNLLYGRWFAADKAGPPLERVSEMLGITHLLDRQPGGLSGGEKQRVALGRALLSNPAMLLMDEPLAALDGERKAEILPYLERLRDETHLPILYVSHAPAEIARLATTVVLLADGRVTAAGPVADVLSDLGAQSVFGAQDSGAIIIANIAAQEDDGLTRLDSAAGPLFLPRIDAALGNRLRLRIMAQDVMISLDRPKDISALNVLPVTIAEIREEPRGVMLRLALGEEHLLSRVTLRSAKALELAPGRQVHAVIKAVSVAEGSIGQTTV